MLDSYRLDSAFILRCHGVGLRGSSKESETGSGVSGEKCEIASSGKGELTSRTASLSANFLNNRCIIIKRIEDVIKFLWIKGVFINKFEPPCPPVLGDF